jgi:hypothetical protein
MDDIRPSWQQIDDLGSKRKLFTQILKSEIFIKIFWNMRNEKLYTRPTSAIDFSLLAKMILQISNFQFSMA